MLDSLLYYMAFLGPLAGLLAAIYFVPALAPVLKWLGEALPKLLDVLTQGLSDIIDNGATILTVLALVIGSYWYGKVSNEDLVRDKIIKELHQQYKFIPKRGGR